MNPTEPTKEFIRRGELVTWLHRKGFTTAAVLDLIALGTIPAHHYPRRRRHSPAKGATRRKPEIIKGRAWFQTSEVAKILKIQ